MSISVDIVEAVGCSPAASFLQLPGELCSSAINGVVNVRFVLMQVSISIIIREETACSFNTPLQRGREHFKLSYNKGRNCLQFQHTITTRQGIFYAEL